MTKCQNCGQPAEMVWSYIRANGERHTMKICGECMAHVWARYGSSHVGQTPVFEAIA